MGKRKLNYSSSSWISLRLFDKKMNLAWQWVWAWLVFEINMNEPIVKFLMLDSVWLVYSLIRNTHKKGILFDRNLNAVMSCAQIITYKFYTPTQKGCLQSMVWIHDHLFLFLKMANVTVHNVASWQCLILLGGHHNFYFASLGFC